MWIKGIDISHNYNDSYLLDNTEYCKCVPYGTIREGDVSGGS
jgi:hypothetical protein